MVVRGSDCIKFVLKTVFCSQNISASKWPEVNKDHPFLVRTHFGHFKPWFGAIILLFYHSFWRRGYPGPPWRPLVPPGAPLDPLVPP